MTYIGRYGGLGYYNSINQLIDSLDARDRQSVAIALWKRCCVLGFRVKGLGVDGWNLAPP